jgi:hypothetical protein
MTIPDAIDQAGRRLQQLSGNNPIARDAIVKETLKYGDWSPTSVIPSDFCYNRTNVAARPAKYRVFLMADPNLDNGLYLHVGRGYAYSDQVVTKPRSSSHLPLAPARTVVASAQSPHSTSQSRSAINRLWERRDEKEWLDALVHYWQNPSVLRNLEVEKFMDSLDVERLKDCDCRAWYEFLEKYFTWKFTGMYLPQKLEYLKETGLENLVAVKQNLFTRDEFELRDIRGCLNIVRSPQIKGLQYAGSSGLLAVLFPEWFGTADRFVVESLREVESLPERDRIRAMEPKSIKEADAVLLIEIMRRKATQLNGWFCTDTWTPRKIDKILWDLRGGA